MKSLTGKQGAIWGGFLILFGAALLVETFTDLSAWAWVAILTVAGFIAFAVYFTDRSDWGLLIPAYVMWAIAGLVALIELGILRDEFVATYALTVIALPFLVTFLRRRDQWWALIPVCILLAVGVMVPLIELGILRDEFVATYVLTAIALPFLVTFLRRRDQWWALIPAYVLLAIGVMIPLAEAEVFTDLLVTAYIMFVIAIPFFVVYVRDRKQWWALIPGGIMAVVGLSFLIAEAAVEYVAAAALILVGAWMLVRQFARAKRERPGR
jgi:hypothetical protein